MTGLTVKGLGQAVAFLTPLGGARAPSRDSLRWFPVIGLGLGLALGGIWWGAEQLWPAPVAAALVVAADLGFTGLLHVDGLTDSADGLLPPLDRQRRLEVMATPGVGAFGMATVVVVLLLRWAALSSTTPNPVLPAALWCASRTAMVIIAAALPYVRPGGLATPFLGGRWVATGVAGTLAALALSVWWRPLAGPVTVAAAAAGAAAVAALARRRIGGFTGDVLGAGGVVAETLGLVAAAARW